MSGEQNLPVQVIVSLEPFDHPDAEDYYANLTGVATTQHELILLFGRILPWSRPPAKGQQKLASVPKLRVTLPYAVAANLAEQLRQQLSSREQIEKARGRGEPEDAGKPSAK